MIDYYIDFVIRYYFPIMLSGIVPLVLAQFVLPFLKGYIHNPFTPANLRRITQYIVSWPLVIPAGIALIIALFFMIVFRAAGELGEFFAESETFQAFVKRFTDKTDL